MAANYDNSAWFYDRLSRIIYGKALLRSQEYLLKHIPPGACILIAGGGTGWILEKIAEVQPPGLKITYVEVSARMMALSKKRDAGQNSVTYINQAVEDMPDQTIYDVVVTPFLFDNFTGDTFQKVFGHIHQNLKPGGLWLNVDFRLTGKWWQTVLLRSMFLFFRIICRIEGRKLPAIAACFNVHGYEVISQKTFFGEFILSTVYKKTVI